ncbi:hypothetical protein GTQ45_02060 [Pyruvatibacter mobilis]|uniref:Uncharacterized protein n=1 Tax=Pyruvatibacter mobilis TaxID=1712261 RepID=A0A845Q8T4_9HYPH|nr:hypothetical protein [Pyruvatibacter mobilis]NBG94516.1 hypothetical protein [Pyruvatibacter mobilis]QJD74036.1 hypothetical protein HG718_00610 [Pyruvatibacter mobilis]GGD03566.1 hypothetical protein GCM10011587_04120 [Pyruvatibacter mobilis]
MINPEPTTFDLIEAAACIWETYLETLREEHERGGGPYTDFVEAHGYATTRAAVIDPALATACHKAFAEAMNAGRYDGPFDWDWCPEFFAKCVLMDADTIRLRDDWQVRAAAITTL